MALVRRVSDKTGRVTWQAVVWSHPDENGKRHALKASAATKPEAKVKEAELVRSREAGTPKRDDRRTVERFLTEWFKRKRGIRETTRDYYNRCIWFIVDGIGSIPLTKLTTRDVSRLYANLPLSPNSLRGVHSVLRQALDEAVSLDYVSNNAADRVKLPPMVRFKYHVITREELNRLFATADKTPIGCAVYVAASTGLRLGELLALTWADVDLKAGQITVSRSMTPNGRLTEPKTDKALRTIRLSAKTIARLSQLPPGDGFLFPWTHSQLEKYWHQVRRTARVSARWHDLRHAFATHMLASGQPVSVVSAYLGHAKVTTTLQTYTHALPGQDEALAAAIDKVMT